MLTKNRQDTQQTDDLIYADPHAFHPCRPDPARRRRWMMVALAVVSLIACLTTTVALGRSIRSREELYMLAQELLEQRFYEEARTAFESLGDYRDSQQQFARLAELATAYDDAVALMARAQAGLARTDPAEEFLTAAAALEALGDYADAPALAAECRRAAEDLRN